MCVWWSCGTTDNTGVSEAQRTLFVVSLHQSIFSSVMMRRLFAHMLYVEHFAGYLESNFRLVHGLFFGRFTWWLTRVWIKLLSNPNKMNFLLLHYWRLYTNLMIFNWNTEMFVRLVDPESSLLWLLHQSDFGTYSNTTRYIFITFPYRMLICKGAAKCVQ